jgi:hypothetical protein
MDIDPALEQPRSLLEPFNSNLFVEHSGWTAVKQILEGSAAGSYGLSGPRGAGKTWVMEKALRRAEEQGGLGVWFPSPSEYEPIAFLGALSEVVATSFERFYDKKTGRTTKSSYLRFVRDSLIGGSVTYFAVILFVFTNEEGGTGNALPAFLSVRNGVLAFLAVAGVVFFARAIRRRREEREGLGKVRQTAIEIRRQVRFTVTATENSESGLSAGQMGIGASLKRAHERQLVERPATLSSLIHNFRAFVCSIAEEVGGPVVIAVDELDKMTDSRRVAQLLRDIKGIFDIPGACFLVSISDEAARALDLGAVRGRNEFNSSFYSVLSMPRLSPQAGLELLRRRDRGFDADCGLAIGILTGGVSRELVRVAELVRLSAGAVPGLSETVGVSLGEELESFSAWALGQAGGNGGSVRLSAQTQVLLFDAVELAKFSLCEGEGDVTKMMSDAWALGAGDTHWRECFAEEWRRLLVRLAVGAALLDDPSAVSDSTRAEQLQRIIAITSGSAVVGRRNLEAMSDRRTGVVRS